MNAKAILMACAVTASLIVTSAASSQQSPRPSKTATQIEALVNKAAALIDKNGKAAFAEFRKKDSGFMTARTCSRMI